MDPRVQAIRADKAVGLGTCSTIDECWSDKELIEQLDEFKVITTEKAIEWAREMEGLHHEQALNCRWGEDSDPELKAQKEFEELCR